nr:hypothetical protein Iba_chr10aCG10420 [Ipomoea batatas]GMD48291.1 hypothetical protein Iba_chr10fCG4940 [Ipomoea batatas]
MKINLEEHHAQEEEKGDNAILEKMMALKNQGTNCFNVGSTLVHRRSFRCVLSPETLISTAVHCCRATKIPLLLPLLAPKQSSPQEVQKTLHRHG